ncbi:MAG: molybdopterin molybdotransferase MoeA [Oscillospiraceae bacterium]|nr:molybdopterin molybdotransferase MoeA [Oscillospiraceae bacterium]
MAKTVSYTEARALACGAVRPVGTETVPLARCWSRVLAEDLVSAFDVPHFDRSPYDGYAVRSADLTSVSREKPITLRVVEEIPAGKIPTRALAPGEAAKILTGAPIPDGADAVVMFEKTEFTAASVTLFEPVRAGDNVVRAGEDVKKGAMLAAKGSVIDSGLLGTLAAQNKASVEVFKRPRVGVISTGSELVPVGSELTPGLITDSNRYTLSGALLALGCEPVAYGIAADNVPAIKAALERALAECDAVVTTGGVSVGDYDLTPASMESAGAEMLFAGCEIKPGMACAYGAAQGKLICALSGNPAAALTNFHLIARPALLKLCGRRAFEPEEFDIELAEAFDKKSPATRVLRGGLDLSGGTAKIVFPREQGNVVLSSAIGCDAMAIIPAGSGKLAAGTKLKGMLI